jgi:thioredoxin-like negative regulator of GroEL
MDIDWTRWKKDAATGEHDPEGESAEDDAEDEALDDWPDLPQLTRRTMNKTIAKHDILVVAIVYPWCPHCSHLYESMSKAAKHFKKLKLDIAFARVDARVEREVAER